MASWPWLSQLVNVVYIDDDGAARIFGSLFDCIISRLLSINNTIDRTTTEEQHPSLPVALTTAGMEIKPLVDEECSM
jgi:hypothetical protein